MYFSIPPTPKCRERIVIFFIRHLATKEQELLKLSKKYSENALEVLFPLFALYYNLDNTKKAKEYLLIYLLYHLL